MIFVSRDENDELYEEHDKDHVWSCVLIVSRTMIQKQLSYTYLHLNQKSRWFAQNKFQFVFKTVYPSFLSMKRPIV